jgi:hypothetical protein
MTEEENRNEKLLLRRYLLGGLAAEEQLALEQQLMTDQDLFDRLLRAEEELIDEYARGQIPNEEKQAFESSFLGNSQRLQDLQFARALRRYVAKQ